MPLADAGRVLFQTTVKNLATHVRLKLRDGLGVISYTPTQSITFNTPDAQVGLRTTSTVYTFDIVLPDVAVPQDAAVEVLSVQLTNTDATVIYMESDFPTAQIFNNDGIFSLTGVVASFF